MPQKRTTVDGDVALMKKELTSLREQLVNKSQELEVDGVSFLQLCRSLSFQVASLRSTDAVTLFFFRLSSKCLPQIE